MNRRDFLLSTAAAAAVTALPLSIQAGDRRMRFEDRPCWFDRGDKYGNSMCGTCGANSGSIGIRGLSCFLQKRGDWRTPVDAEGYMHHGTIDGPYVTKADFHQTKRLSD